MRITRRQLKYIITEHIGLLDEVKKLDCYSESKVDAACKRAVVLLGFGGETLALFLKEIAVKESGSSRAGLRQGDKGFKIDCFLKAQGAHLPSSKDGGGPGIGPWQVEPKTFEFLKKNWKLADIRKTIKTNADGGLVNPLSSQSISTFTNTLSIQAVMVALKMIDKMNPMSTAQSQDRKNNQATTFDVPTSREERADLWKTYYNTSSGKGTKQEYIDINEANDTK